MEVNAEKIDNIPPDWWKVNGCKNGIDDRIDDFMKTTLVSIQVPTEVILSRLAVVGRDGRSDDQKTGTRVAIPSMAKPNDTKKFDSPENYWHLC